MQGEVVEVNVNEIQTGPLGPPLSTRQEERIQRIWQTFGEVSGSVSEWIDNFRRDECPDLELAIWERMAVAYETFFAERKELLRFGLEVKKEAFAIVLMSTMHPKPRVVADAKGAAKWLKSSHVSRLCDLYATGPHWDSL